MCTDHIFLAGVTEIQPKATWKQLVLPKRVMDNLREFMLWTSHSHVTEKWGAQISTGPVALFRGPAGTGKTLAAEVLANALKRPLFRVDLGLLVGKYIGETDKNLDALFRVATSENGVLFFDEADALFGKRTEVKDAHDRYANLEVSYLLTRIEQHQIPCILTSNSTERLDPDFAHRLQMVVDFPMPDSRTRARLWRHYLPAKAPRERGLNLNLVGRHLVLTGAQIRNAALHAALHAAQDSSPIGWKQISKAALREIAKTEAEKPEERLGKLRQHLA